MFINKPKSSFLSISYPGKINKVEFDPFDQNRFMLLFENEMSVFQVGIRHDNLNFGKYVH